MSLWQRQKAKHLNVGFKILLFGPWVNTCESELGVINITAAISSSLVYLYKSLKEISWPEAWASNNWFPFQAGQRIPLEGCINHQALWAGWNTLAQMQKVTLDWANLVNTNELELPETSVYACQTANFTIRPTPLPLRPTLTQVERVWLTEGPLQNCSHRNLSIQGSQSAKSSGQALLQANFFSAYNHSQILFYPPDMS